MQNQLAPAYSAPARINVRGSWDVYAFGSFTYWQPRQENMELAFVNNTAATEIDGNFVNMDFKYKPGFKVGLGLDFNHDNWDAAAIYTWFRGSFTQSSSVDGFNSEIYPLFGHMEAGDNTAYNTAAERWKLHIDLLDVELGRSYYSGMSLTVRPFFGARGAWIRQNLSAVYAALAPAFLNDTTFDVSQKTHSWAVGPRAGLYTNWIVGQGFRLYGNGAGDILYTRYTKLNEHDTVVQNGVLVDDVRARQQDLDYLRTHMELELGIGWGSYFDNNNWHIDLAAGYTFQVFFNQNMFRAYSEATFASAGAYSRNPNGDLFIHGLTASARFDF